MYVNVEDIIALARLCCNSSLLFQFPSGNQVQVLLPVGMSAGLNPLAQFSVKHEYCTVARSVDGPCRSSEVAWQTRPHEASRTTFEKPQACINLVTF
jgi:hypothetical protein